MIKRLQVAVLVYFMLALLLPVSDCYANRVYLTTEEEAYLSQLGPVTVCVDPDWPPFEWITANGEHAGISADLLRLVSERTGVQLQLVKTKSWDESIELSKKGQCKVLAFLNQTPKRDAWLIFTEPTFTDPNVFITREEHPYIADLNYFSNETIVFPAGTAMEELIRAKYPNLRFITVETENDALRLVAEKKADMAMRSLFVAAYTIKKDGLFNLKIAGQLPEYTNNLRMGVQKDDVMLRDILNKGISTITAEEKWQIINKHISINVQTETDYRLVAEITIAFLLLFVVGVYWNYQLKNHNKELLRVAQTDALTNIYNRKKLDEELLREYLCAKKKQQAFSLILLDIDNFKKVNDELGHLVGDMVIKEVTQVVKAITQTENILGRWGGEEFLILCPAMDIVSSHRLAERICQAVAAHAFSTQQMHTISAGVACLASDDQIDSLLQRADMCLYQAKLNGKNQVCSHYS